jgi:DNA repair protein RadC
MQTGMMRLLELTVRYEVRKDHEGQPIVVGRDLDSPRETASALMTALQDQPSEVFAILCVSTKLRDDRLSRGQPRHARRHAGPSALMLSRT